MSMMRKQAWISPANHAIPVSSGAEHIRQRVGARQCCSAGGNLAKHDAEATCSGHEVGSQHGPATCVTLRYH
jgi:hypothetical protein